MGYYKNLKIEILKIYSFTTTVTKEESRTIIGGYITINCITKTTDNNTTNNNKQGIDGCSYERLNGALCCA